MSFELRKQLADLKAECNALFEQRLSVLRDKKENAISLMVDEAVSFLQEQGFTVINNIPSTIEANYKGSMNIRIQFSDPADSFIGADITIDVDYLNQSYGFSVNLKRAYFNAIQTGDLSTEIMQYQAMIKRLAELGWTDIDGSFEIVLIKQDLNKLTFSSMEEVLAFVLEM
ncbi:kinase [Avibacterium paragallinarum]|uniref:kinase n=1 Tax=Avibacterium paragallinarum TaxID=728 RepID=UPI00397A5D29